MTDNADLSFAGSDPGAVKYGNFINYYTFHSAIQRTNNLHPHMFEESRDEDILLCLDIGCNTGELTLELFVYLKSKVYPKKEIHILAIDIDPSLIERAKDTHSNTNISFITSNIMIEKDREAITSFLAKHKKTSFNISFCFSVTMWIHINNGDEGLLEFLSFIKQHSQTIILEPQPWNCYRNAQRRIKKSGGGFPLYDALNIRSNVNDVIEKYLVENSHEKVYESPSSLWKRKIISFHKK